MARLSPVRVILGPDTLEIRLRWWQKPLGLMGNISVARSDISDVEVLEDPVRAAMGGGFKAGLRIPWLYFIARTIRLDQAFIVRRNVPGLSFDVANNDPLRHVIVSTPDAAELARELTAAA